MNTRNGNAARQQVLRSRNLMPQIVARVTNARNRAALRATSRIMRSFIQEVVPIDMIGHTQVVRWPDNSAGAAVKFIPSVARYRRWSAAQLADLVLQRLSHGEWTRRPAPILQIWFKLLEVSRGLGRWEQSGATIPPRINANVSRLLHRVRKATVKPRPFASFTEAYLHRLDKVTLFLLAWAVDADLGPVS